MNVALGVFYVGLVLVTFAVGFLLGIGVAVAMHQRTHDAEGIGPDRRHEDRRHRH